MFHILGPSLVQRITEFADSSPSFLTSSLKRFRMRLTIKQGRSFEIFASVQEGDYDIKRGAEKMNLSIDEFKKQMASAGYEVPQSMQ